MREQKYTILVEQGEDGYLIAEVLELPGCHTQARTYDALMKRTKEAIALYREAKPEIKPSNQFLGLQQVVV